MVHRIAEEKVEAPLYIGTRRTSCAPPGRARFRARSGRRCRGPDLGNPAAVPRDVVSSARPGLLVARRSSHRCSWSPRALSSCSSSLARCSRIWRRRCSRTLRWSTGSSRRHPPRSASACSPRRSSGPRSGVCGRGGRTSGRGRLRARRPPVARDGVLHELGDPHVRARIVGGGPDARGRAELGLVHGSLPPVVAADVAARVRSSTGIAFIVHEQNPWFFARSAFLHHLLGWTFIACAASRCSRICGRVRPATGGFALSVVLVSVMLFCRSRRRAGLRPSVVARGGAAPMRALLLVALLALVFPASRSAHATLVSTRPGLAPSCGAPDHDSPPLRPDRHGAARLAPRPERGRQELRGPRSRGNRPRLTRARRFRSVPTRCAGSRSPRTRTSSRACGRSASACPRPR